MKQQTRHNLLQFFLYMCTCSLGGFTAVFLQYKGMSNTWIGIITGLGSCGILFGSPLINYLMQRFSWLSVKKTLYLSFSAMIFFYFLMTWPHMPRLIIGILYVSTTILIFCMLPLITLLSTEYIRKGNSLNYGVSRGFGSISYATGAVICGRLCQWLTPDILGLYFLISAVCLMLTIRGIDDVRPSASHKSEKKNSMLFLFTRYPLIGRILIFYVPVYASSIALSTYMVNIVKALGGNTSLYGIMVFFLAASEMPAMSLVPKLRQKYGSLSLVCFSVICYVIRNTLISIAPNFFVLVLGCIFQSGSFAIFFAVMTYYITDQVAAEDQLTAQSLFNLITCGLAATIGNVMGGVLQDWFGLKAVCLTVIVLSVTGANLILLTIHRHTIANHPK